MKVFVSFPFHLGLILALLTVLLAGEAVVLQQHVQPVVREPLRVVAPAHVWRDSRLSPFGPGFEQELLDIWQEKTGQPWIPVECATWEQAWRILDEGRADVLLSQGTVPPEDMEAPLRQGPVYARFYPAIISKRSPGAPDVLTDKTQPCQQPVLLDNSPQLIYALQSTRIDPICTPQVTRQKTGDISPVLKNLSNDETRFALIDTGRLRLWNAFYPTLRVARQMNTPVSYCWYWNERYEGTAHALSSFWQTMEFSPVLLTLYDKYFGFLPEKTNRYEIRHLLKTIRTKLPQYRETIFKVAAEFNIDPLLFIALIYQESHFEEDARSYTGVRGLLQITKATAAVLNIDRTRAHQSIMGGGRYLRSLFDRLESAGLDSTHRWLLALASYNQGIGHVRDAMMLSTQLGGTGKTWPEVRQVFPKLHLKEYYKNTQHGYTRGNEAVQYVDKIRYYYYILNGLVILSRPEAQYLSPDVSLASLARLP